MHWTTLYKLFLSVDTWNCFRWMIRSQKMKFTPYRWLVLIAYSRTNILETESSNRSIHGKRSMIVSQTRSVVCYRLTTADHPIWLESLTTTAWWSLEPLSAKGALRRYHPHRSDPALSDLHVLESGEPILKYNHDSLCPVCDWRHRNGLLQSWESALQPLESTGCVWKHHALLFLESIRLWITIIRK